MQPFKTGAYIYWPQYDSYSCADLFKVGNCFVVQSGSRFYPEATPPAWASVKVGHDCYHASVSSPLIYVIPDSPANIIFDEEKHARGNGTLVIKTSNVDIPKAEVYSA